MKKLYKSRAANTSLGWALDGLQGLIGLPALSSDRKRIQEEHVALLKKWCKGKGFKFLEEESNLGEPEDKRYSIIYKSNKIKSKKEYVHGSTEDLPIGDLRVDLRWVWGVDGAVDSWGISFSSYVSFMIVWERWVFFDKNIEECLEELYSKYEKILELTLEDALERAERRYDNSQIETKEALKRYQRLKKLKKPLLI